VKANSQATARFKTYVDYDLSETDSHITIFRGIRTGIFLTLLFFWFPFVIMYYIFGWLFMIGYGVALATIFSFLGLASRFHSFLRSFVHSKSSAEAFES